MAKQLFKFINGKLTKVYDSEIELEDYDLLGVKGNKSAYVHTDEIIGRPLKNMVTGKLYTSKSKYIKDVKALGLEIVGNDKLSQRKHTPRQTLTDEMILDRIQRAESILEDPAKYRARQNENLERLERYKKLVHGNRR